LCWFGLVISQGQDAQWIWNACVVLRSAWARVRVNGLLAGEIVRAVFGVASAGLADRSIAGTQFWSSG